MAGGILTGALLGGVKGTGEGMAEGAKLDWQEQMQRAIDERQERNIRLQGTIQEGLETNVRQPFASEQGRLGREQQSSEGALTRQSREAEAGMNRESAETIAAGNNAARERAAALARRQAQADAMKDLPASVKEYIGVQRERLKALDAAEANPMTDDATRAGIASQKAALSDIIEQALTTKTIPARKPVAPAPKAPGAPVASSFWKRMTGQDAAPGDKNKAPAQTQPAEPKLAASQFLTRQRDRYIFQASPKSSAAAKQLNGRTFKTPEEAQAEYDKILSGL
jgi:hypothetical protein